MSNIQGGRNPNARLSRENVLTIRKRYAEGATQRELCKVYGVSHNTIARIIHGETWGWLNDNNVGMPPLHTVNLPPLTQEQEEAALESQKRLIALLAKDGIKVG